ncbi:MAG: hypothetical protein K8R35_03060, partial [Bacteroidales bacterium]|nr:hypothetical protein [Bacteroidales bacterium]
MKLIEIIDKISITPKSQKLLFQLFEENRKFADIIKKSKSSEEANRAVYKWVMDWMKDGHKEAIEYFKYKKTGRKVYKALTWREVGAIRLLDYVNNAGRVFENLNKKIKESVSDPIHLVWIAFHHG